MTGASSIRDILDFWFLPLGDAGHGQARALWWESTPELDREITEKFGPALAQAAAGALDGWTQSPDGALALIVLCDQFSRNIHRRTAQAFATDAKALAMARIALAHFYPAIYPSEIRHFFFMPFGHSEQLADQELACALIATVGSESAIKSAIEHRDVVARFGRFPHRNAVLGRTSTPEELDYLKSAERYGQ